MGPTLTGYLILAWLAIAGLYTLLARLLWGVDATVSVVAYDFCRENPIAEFAVGVVLGHVLWPAR